MKTSDYSIKLSEETLNAWDGAESNKKLICAKIEKVIKDEWKSGKCNYLLDLHQSYKRGVFYEDSFEISTVEMTAENSGVLWCSIDEYEYNGCPGMEKHDNHEYTELNFRIDRKESLLILKYEPKPEREMDDI